MQLILKELQKNCRNLHTQYIYILVALTKIRIIFKEKN